MEQAEEEGETAQTANAPKPTPTPGFQRQAEGKLQGSSGKSASQRGQKPAAQPNWDLERMLAGLRQETKKGSDDATKDKEATDDSPGSREGSKGSDSKSETGSGKATASTGKSSQENHAGAGHKPVKAMVSADALRQWLMQEAAVTMFRTARGLESGAEIARQLQEGIQKLDFQTQDNKSRFWVRGEKVKAEGKPEQVQQLSKQETRSKETGLATGGGAIAGKDGGWVQFGSQLLPPAIRSVLPQLRQLGHTGVVERLKEWMSTPAQAKTRAGAEYSLLSGFVHLAALQAVANCEEVESSELTTSPAGDRMDLVRGPLSHLPLDEELTALEALTCGGAIDDNAEVHEVRVRADAPQIMFVVDGSGSMGSGDRMMSAAVAATATAQKYGPIGATFGLIAFTHQPSLLVRMPEVEVRRVVDAIFSIAPTFGTAYAPALELAFRHSPPKTTVVVLGDFEDSGLLSQEALSIKKSKELHVVGVVSSDGHPAYALKVCDEVHLVNFRDPTSVALVAVQAAVH